MKIQKRLAAQILNASHKRIRFNRERLADIDEAITKTDIRVLVDEKAITKIDEKGISRGRARKILKQKAKGKRKGQGSRQGKKTARLASKEQWMNKIRSQRELIKRLKENGNITKETYRQLYRKSKGGYFRSQRHIKIYLEDQKLIVKKESTVPKKSMAKKKVVKK